MAILDPVATLPMLVALVSSRVRLARWALGWLVAYIAVGTGITWVAKDQARELLAAQGFEPVALRAPVPLVFTPLRRISARDANGDLLVGMHAVWAPERTELVPLSAPSGERVQAALATERGEILTWFSDGFLSVQEVDGDLWILDQRYGMFADPTWTPFRARLPAGAPVEGLELGERGGAGIDGGAEWQAGLRLMFGP